MDIYNNLVQMKEDYIMGNNGKNKKKNGNDSSGSIKEEAEKKNTWLKKSAKSVGAFLNNSIVSLIIGAILIPIFLNILQSITEIREDIAGIKSDVSNLQGNYESTNTKVWELAKDGLSAKKDTDSDIATEENVISVFPEEEYIQRASAMFASDKTVFENENEEVWDSKQVIIGKVKTNMGSGEESELLEVTVGDLENKIVSFAYKDNGEDVLFYGKFSDDNKWDGNCITNRFKDGKLTFIMDAEYENGQLKSYKQVFVGENGEKKKVWYVSERIVEGEVYKGETYRYFKYGDYEKKINDGPITQNDIMSVDAFRQTIPSSQEGYYSGYTSDGKFNDKSGEAYLVKYNESGKVIYLYKGKMKDGWPEDNSGEAWSISWGHGGDGYYYYKGNFVNKERATTPKNWKPCTQEEINSIINPDEFNCSLEGLLNTPIEKNEEAKLEN